MELPSAILEFERVSSASKPAPARIFRWGEVDDDISTVIEEEDEGSAGANDTYGAARNGLKSVRTGAGT